MKLVVLRSVPPAPGQAAGGDYFQEADIKFAERVLGNLCGDPGYCAACGPDCCSCRAAYDLDRREKVAAVLEVPAALPHVLEKPAEHLPPRPPAHDVLLAVGVHEQVLLEAIRRAPEWGTRGVVVPLEGPGWVSPAARAEGLRLGEELGVEVAFPKPFCSFRPPAGSLLEDFRREIGIGHPEMIPEIKDGRIERVRVEVSAACGATYYVARWLEGRRLDEEIRYAVLSKRLHAYPCTASMEMDEELGDTFMHVAGHAHAEVLERLGLAPAGEGDRSAPIVTHTGLVLSEPLTGLEGRAAMERARETILAELAAGREPVVDELGRLPGLNPAAVASAVVTLKREGRVRVAGGVLLKGSRH
jgi:hypothetical protein